MITVAPVLWAVLAVLTAGAGSFRIVARPTRTPVPTVAEAARRGRRRGPPAADASAMAEWCEQVARSLRSGVSLTRAMHEGSNAVPHAGSAFAPALAALERGRGLADALADLDDDPSTPAGLVTGVLGSCAVLGGPAARPLDRTAAVLHARAAERAERMTASAQARLSARVLTILPVATLGLMTLAEPSTRASIATSVGLVCVAVGGACNLIGWWWMRRIIGRTT